MSVHNNAQSREAKIQALRARHSEISDEIEQVRKSPGIADYVLQDLKKKKLEIKDEIELIGQKTRH